ncbi:hypothetical protein [Carnobacterium pleistocenium]|uniref:hypothetical protein n=1 Tax=Carnobacterium pleistocenium TaxID=181073 RepID=UPI0005500532|nr:hypothetical protein [Carnobacterium pleistocenium]
MKNLMTFMPFLLKIIYLLLSIAVIWLLPIQELTRNGLLLVVIFFYWGLSKSLSKRRKDNSIN